MQNEDKLIVVSDGSFVPIGGKADYAWIITTPEKTAWIKKDDAVRENPRYIASYRSELVGIISLLKYVKEKGFSNTQIEMWCNNKAVVHILNNEKEINIKDIDMAKSDLVKAGKELTKQLTKVTLRHIKGHQTDEKR